MDLDGRRELRESSWGFDTMGAPNPSNIPGARQASAVWIDAQGNLWLFTGHGYDSAGPGGPLNDVWRHEP